MFVLWDCHTVLHPQNVIDSYESPHRDPCKCNDLFPVSHHVVVVHVLDIVIVIMIGMSHPTCSWVCGSWWFFLRVSWLLDVLTYLLCGISCMWMGLRVLMIFPSRIVTSWCFDLPVIRDIMYALVSFNILQTSLSRTHVSDPWPVDQNRLTVRYYTYTVVTLFSYFISSDRVFKDQMFRSSDTSLDFVIMILDWMFTYCDPPWLNIILQNIQNQYSLNHNTRKNTT